MTCAEAIRSVLREDGGWLRTTEIERRVVARGITGQQFPTYLFYEYEKGRVEKRRADGVRGKIMEWRWRTTFGAQGIVPATLPAPTPVAPVVPTVTLRGEPLIPTSWPTAWRFHAARACLSDTASIP